MNTLELCLRIVAVAQVMLAALSLCLPRILDWKADIARMSPLVRQVFEIHSWFIALTLVIWGVLTWRFAPDMAAHATPLTQWLCAAIGLFWGIRCVLQWTHYSSSHWRGNPGRTVIHWTFFFGYGAWATLYFITAFRPLNDNQMVGYQQRLEVSDPKARLAVIEELGKLILESPKKVGNQAIPLLTKGLTDPDEAVRYNAVSHIAATSVQNSPKLGSLKPGGIDLRTYPPLKAAIERLFSDPKDETRSNALTAYVNIFDLTPELQERLIVRYSKEEPFNKELIVESLAACESPTKSSVEFVLHAIDDRQYAPRIATAWWQMKGRPPQTVLAKLADLLIKTQDAYERQMFALVMAKYGAEARPYLKQIESLEEKETDIVAKNNLRRAAEAVRTGKPLQE